MKRAGAVCPNCGSTSTPAKEKMMGQDTQDLICVELHGGLIFNLKSKKTKTLNNM